MIRSRADLRPNVSVRVVGVRDASGLWIGRSEKARQRIVSKGPGTPVSGIWIIAFLVDCQKIVEDVVRVVGFVIETCRVFKDLRQPAQAIGTGFAGSSLLIGRGRTVARVHGRDIIRGSCPVGRDQFCDAIQRIVLRRGETPGWLAAVCGRRGAADLLPKIRAEVYMKKADCVEEGAWRRGSIAKWR